jgi:hypothetical protein
MVLYYNIYIRYSLDAWLIVVICYECTYGYKGSNIENTRELNLPAMTGGGEEVDAQITNNMEKEGQEDMQVVIHSGPSSQSCKCRRLSKAQYGLLEESYQQNNYPDKVTSVLE